MIEKFYLVMTDRMPIDWALPDEPDSTPWLAVILLPGVALAPEAEAWLGDFERCMAWLLLEVW